MVSPPDGSDEERWRRFTPSSIDRNLCFARTWKGGAGGQCSKRPIGDEAFCSSHLGDRWQVHGRVDGPIPEKKLKEFERIAASSSSSSAAATSSGSCQGGRGNKAATMEAAELGEAAAVEAASAAAAASGGSCQRGRGRGGGRKAEAVEAANLGETAAVEAASSAAAAGSGTCQRGRGRGAGSKAAAAKAASATPAARRGSKVPAQETGSPEFDTPRSSGKRLRRSPSARVPPSSVQVSRSATMQVSEISAQIESMPRSLRKSAWRDKMRMFHPDKRQLMQAQFPQLSEEQMGEVFIELKRRYDFMAEQEATPRPGKRLWGAAAAKADKSPEW
eukprot:TRINITY_DN79031_c0_g1_i1.p1 TRINITY_DN79031_c0_g1~~TRINITY_DN79031_c0_g1_i1.p1  ORF type:complete len:333 (+),score=77.50 TRINITY_DN79031_c0_g1_i1:25-1023(+)